MLLEDRYEVLDKIGTGGMSDVYKAKDLKLNRFVAIKFLKTEFCEDKNFVSNFKVEAQSAAALLHPNVVSVYDVNDTDGIYYIVMEYVDGITLKKYININGKLPAREATSIAIQVAQGMEAAHNAGIIHRDIKPQNVLISREGKIKVTDFGIARTTTANTLSADVLGSAQYISPEQARGDSVDARSDIYSFGIMFYEMLTGTLPFEGDSPVTIALKHIQEQVPKVSQVAPDVPSSVARIVEKCTQKRVDRRYQKTSSLLSDLKTSLVNPNDDFVILEAESDDSATVIMTKKDADLLKEEGGKAEQVEAAAPIPKKRVLIDREDDFDEFDDLDDEYDDYDDYDLDEDRSGRRFDKVLTICGIIAGVIILIVLIIVLITNFFGGGFSGCAGTGRRTSGETTTPAETVSQAASVEMPDVVGKNIEEAKKILEDKGIKYEIVTEPNAAEKDTVINQSVVKGSQVSASNVVTLVVSAGQKMVKLPDLTNEKQDDAVKKLKDLGLKSRITTKYDSSVETGRVIETDPKGGSEVPEGSTVELKISRGTESRMATVPNMIGYDEVDAWEMARNAGIELEIHYQENEENIGIVIHQSIAGGESVEEGTTVTVIVGIAPEPEPDTEEPDTEEEPSAEEPTTEEAGQEDTTEEGGGEEDTTEEGGGEENTGEEGGGEENTGEEGGGEENTGEEGGGEDTTGEEGGEGTGEEG